MEGLGSGTRRQRINLIGLRAAEVFEEDQISRYNGPEQGLNDSKTPHKCFDKNADTCSSTIHD